MGHAGWGADTLKVIRCNFTTLAADAAAALGRRLVERGTVRSLPKLQFHERLDFPATFSLEVFGMGRLRCLDLCYCELGALGVELSLGANAITARGAVAAVSIATGLRRLDLEINQLGDEGCKLVAQKVLLRVTTTLQHLDLGMNSIGPDGALALASALRKNMALTRLDLGYNRIGSVGAEALAQALMSNTALKVLRLEDNAVGDLGATALVSGATRLQELELAFNQVRAEGAVAVAAALRSPTELRRLGLRGNELRDAGASALAAAISKNCGLQDLSLQSNAIGSAGGSALVQALRGNWRLTALDVTENAITQEAATSIAEMTRQARVVHEEALRPPSSRDLAEGTQRRFPTEWSVRAWLGWISKDGRESDIKTLVSVSHAAAVMAAEAAVLSYDLARLRDLASIYGRRLAPAGRQKEAAKGVYLLNLTPFCIQVTVGKSSKAVQMKDSPSPDKPKATKVDA
ncbi:NLRC3 [Symbiodinium natans]|uniref:NLRC3 protein n=1 Tax=Symbiodinium natans TaxID=878477 RepID=A0A812PUX8_9DINO|nr:NLRC3 [Symbiodinium natans]